MEPMPDEALLSDLYSSDYLASNGAHVLEPALETAAELGEVVAELVRHRPGGNVLDVGCGAGEFLVRARTGGLSPEGLEKVASVARSVAEAAKVTVHAGSPSKLAITYDFVHLADVLEHLPDPLAMLNSLKPLVRATGLVVVRGPLENQRNLFQMATVLARSTRGRLRTLERQEMKPYHVILFTLEGWRALLTRAGFERRGEWIYETRWPAPSAFGAKSVLKRISMGVSNSSAGRWMKSGNRVVSFLSTPRE